MNDSLVQIHKYQARSSTVLHKYHNCDLNYLRNWKNNISLYQDIMTTRPQDVILNNSIMLNQTPYITSEKYHLLNKGSSHKSIFRSTSTLFYDLDQIAKRHSYHCINDINTKKSKLIKETDNKRNKHGFKAKSEAIVQECATKFHPKIKIRDSTEMNTMKFKEPCVNNPNLSSEIFLRDSEKINAKEHNYAKKISNHHQKLWSYAKYRTEYTNPISNSKKYKKRDSGKRTEDPCPCQLFSYACPCTNKKSLTELARNSKSLTGVNQITSTTKISSYDCNSKLNKLNALMVKEQKPGSAQIIEFTDTFEMSASRERLAQTPEKQDIPQLKDNSLSKRNKRKGRHKVHKKTKQFVCPNCKEKVEVVSITEEVESLDSKNSPLIHNHETFSMEENTNSLLKTQTKESVGDDDACIHSPPCELVPVCQILPKDNGCVSGKCSKQQQAVKPSPRSIRITKACRHHPPCTVVPSCQRINVLRNNCEYIPPCLHRPRCINLPLCVPISKTLEYDLLHKQVNEADNSECIHVPRCNFYPVCQYDSLNNNGNTEFHSIQNTCEYLSEYAPRFIVNPKMPCISQTFSPCHVPHAISCKCCKYNKSCQYDCVDCKCSNAPKKVRESASSDAIIYIRDVGCQFRNRFNSPGDSLDHSKISSASFNFEDRKTGYFSNFHTLRYEDKFTNPISGEELSMSTVSTTSLDIDDHCPSHGKQVFQSNHKRLSTGFSPQPTNSPFVGTVTAHTNSPVKQNRSKINNIDASNHSKSHLVKSRRSFLRTKHKCVFSVRRRRKVRTNSHIFSTHRKISCSPIQPL